MKKTDLMHIVTPLVILTVSASFICGCGEYLQTEEAGIEIVREVNEHYPDDVLTYKGAIPKTSDYTVEASSANYPDSTIQIRRENGTVVSNYYALARSEATGAFFTDLLGEYFDCDHIDSTWHGWWRCYMEYNDMSDEEFIHTYIDYNFTAELYYEEYPSEEEIEQVILQLIDDINAPCNITLDFYSASDADGACDFRFYAVNEGDDPSAGTYISSGSSDNSCYIQVTYYNEVLRDYTI